MISKLELTPQIISNWEGLIKPSKLIIEPLGSDNSAKVIIAPLERGLGITLGNALRRILLSSLQGAAITAVKIQGVLHEFSNIPGVSEDVVEIILNIKSIIVKMVEVKKRILRLNVKGPCTVTAGMIQEAAEVQIMNPNQIICTLAEDTELEMEFTCEVGKGYMPVSYTNDTIPIGTIFLDALYNPIKNVTFYVEDTRIGRVTDYDKLTMEVSTNGTVTPGLAVALAAKILQDQLQLFVTFENQEIESEVPKEDLPFNPVLLKRIEELELSVRPQNCVKNDNIVFIGDLVTKTEAEMLKMPNFGKKSLNELKEILKNLGLHFGMEVKGWPPVNKEELSKIYNNNNNY